MATLKQLLGVRVSTCRELVLLEAGICDAKAYIRERQQRYFQKLAARPNYTESYIGYVISMAIRVRTQSGILIQSILDNRANNIGAENLEALRINVRSSTTTRRTNYMTVNPELSMSCAYEKRSLIPEHHRIAYTRMRLSSHRLRIETGRWSRIAIENRTCPCGEVLTEEHVLLNGPPTIAMPVLPPF